MLKVKKQFLLDKKLLSTHLGVNWKLITFYAVFWLIVSVIVLVTLVMLSGQTTIASFAMIKRDQDAHWGGWTTTSGYGISWGLHNVIASTPGIVFFGIVTISLVSVAIIKELKSGQINLWMTSQLSRNQILFSKNIYIWISLLIIQSPSFIFILIFSGISNDATTNLVYVFLQMLYFFIFTLLMSSLFTFIAVSLSEKGYLWVIICSAILFYALVMWVLTLVYALFKENPDLNSITQVLKYVQYFTPESLIANWINYVSISDPDLEKIKETLAPGEQITIYGNRVSTNIVWSVLSPIINIFISSVFTFLAISMFKNKDLSI
ncbi:hypothetical protein ESOMN_v1c01270 [Williamsoniiplasma somnilux]|uniref:Uncharacterized protein n=1 Tax=Williamsoniiplasma somnilux TaxID=215578 RepID=A0A2K8NXE7_9MOLU|nr:ABC transporter permease subunit [Williamsoniiplasma somnilux]ATZ18512.1 hypothetical protein ESOMN_v1c01270 [Williamsoniiplasma somnilux]